MSASVPLMRSCSGHNPVAEIPVSGPRRNLVVTCVVSLLSATLGSAVTLWAASSAHEDIRSSLVMLQERVDSLGTMLPKVHISEKELASVPIASSVATPDLEKMCSLCRQCQLPDFQAFGLAVTAVEDKVNLLAAEVKALNATITTVANQEAANKVLGLAVTAIDDKMDAIAGEVMQLNSSIKAVDSTGKGFDLAVTADTDTVHALEGEVAQEAADVAKLEHSKAHPFETCEWLCYSYGEYITCPASKPVMRGVCGSGSYNDCGVHHDGPLPVPSCAFVPPQNVFTAALCCKD